MIGNTNFNLTQSINSFINPMGLSLSNKKQIIAKITTVALAAIFLVGNMPSVMAMGECREPCLTNCVNNCPLTAQGVAESTCAQQCFTNCCT